MLATKKLGALILAGFLCGACTENNGDEPTAPYRAQLVTSNGALWNGNLWNGSTWNGSTWNGSTWNGGSWNGGSWNGGSWNGGSWNGGSWNGGTWNGIAIQSLSLTVEGSLLKGIIQPGNRVVSGPDFIGSVFQITHNISDTQKEVLSFRIDDVYLDNGTPFNDIWRYKVSVKSSLDNTWHSFCYDEAGQPADLVPLVGMAWDFATGNRIDSPNAFTLACKSGALEKCVHLGYRPWASGLQCTGSGRSKKCSQVSLKDYHQACTRMIRADYCGTGQSYTVDGTLIDIFDYLLPPIQLREENWAMESRWVSTGAICLSQPRHPELWPGGCPSSDPNDKNLRKLPQCNPYEINRGLIVSTYDSDNNHRH